MLALEAPLHLVLLICLILQTHPEISCLFPQTSVESDWTVSFHMPRILACIFGGDFIITLIFAFFRVVKLRVTPLWLWG